MDTWQHLGCEGWGASQTHPYFERVFEQVSLEKTPSITPLSQAFLKAAKQAGFALLTFNIDGELREGVGIFQLNARNGLRQSSAQAYIHSMLPSPHNLTILTNTTASKIALDENNVAYAVETDTAIIKASRELVLCCGTFDTPKLLLLSGSGPRHHLDEMGIPLKVELAGVREHLLHHPPSVIIWDANQPASY